MYDYQKRTPEEQAAATAAYDARCAQERAELSARIQATTTLIADIGDELEADPAMPAFTLKLHEGNEHGQFMPSLETQNNTYSLHFEYVYGKPDMLHISGTNWPRYKDNRGDYQTVFPSMIRCESPRINVNATRPLAAIVKDIKRRLLPEVKAAWDACMQRAKESQSYSDATMQTARDVAAALGAQPYKPDRCYGEVKIWTDSTDVVFNGPHATFSVRANSELAVIIAKHLSLARQEYIEQRTAEERTDYAEGQAAQPETSANDDLMSSMDT